MGKITRLGLLLLLGVACLSANFTNSNSNYRIKTIVIDPGHGGKDKGCNGATAFEKNVALAIGLKLGNAIKQAHPTIQIVYTRDKDVFVPLYERADIANAAAADLFISIHCNAAVSNPQKAFGSETYVMGLHTADENLAVMKRENEVVLLEEGYEANYDFDPHSPESHILSSIVQNAYLEQSINLASKVETRFKKGLGRKSRGVKQAGFAVLRKTAMPSILIETGFLTHASDEVYLNTPDGQTEMANAIFEAFEQYKNEVEGGVTAAAKAVKYVETPAAESNGVVLKNLEYEFKIQLTATSQPQNTNFAPWNAIAALEMEVEKGIYKYLQGGFLTYEAALAAKQKWQEAGYKGAFVVVYRFGQRIAMEEYLSAQKK